MVRIQTPILTIETIPDGTQQAKQASSLPGVSIPVTADELGAVFRGVDIVVKPAAISAAPDIVWTSPFSVRIGETLL